MMKDETFIDKYFVFLKNGMAEQYNLDPLVVLKV